MVGRQGQRELSSALWMAAPASRDSPLSPQGRGASLCLSHCREKRKSSHIAWKILPTIFYRISSLSVLTLSPFPSGEGCVFLLPCLVGIVTMGFLCSMCHCPKMLLYGKRWGIRVSTDHVFIGTRYVACLTYQWAVRSTHLPPNLGSWTNLLPCSRIWTENVTLRGYVCQYHSPLRIVHTEYPWVFSHLGIYSSFSLIRMQLKGADRKVCGLSQQAHSFIHSLDTRGNMLAPVRLCEDWKGFWLRHDRRRFSSCIRRGDIGTLILPSCPAVESHAAVNSTSWWPRRKA